MQEKWRKKDDKKLLYTMYIVKNEWMCAENMRRKRTSEKMRENLQI